MVTLFIMFTFVVLSIFSLIHLEPEEPEEPQEPPSPPETITTDSGLQITTLFKPEDCTAEAKDGYKVTVCYLCLSSLFALITGSLCRNIYGDR